MTIWFDTIAMAAGVPAPIDHRPIRRPAQRKPAKTRRTNPLRRFVRDVLTDIGGAVPLRAFQGLRRWRKRRKAITELQALDDRTLKDIGIDRGQIRDLVDAQLRFEAETGAKTAAADPRPRFGARPCVQPC